MTAIPKPKSGRPRTWRVDTATTKKPYKVLVNGRVEVARVRAAAAQYNQSYGANLKVRTEELPDGRIRVVVYKGERE